MTTREPLPDYASAIRAQIEHEVEQAEVRLSEEQAGHQRATRVDIGYLANSHHGMPLFKDGDRVRGLPVTIDRVAANQILVRSTGDDIELR